MQLKSSLGTEFIEWVNPIFMFHQRVINNINATIVNNNFVDAAINIFCNQNNIDLQIVDAGVNADFDESTSLVNYKVAKGTSDYIKEPAMCTILKK